MAWRQGACLAASRSAARRVGGGVGFPGLPPLRVAAAVGWVLTVYGIASGGMKKGRLGSGELGEVFAEACGHLGREVRVAPQAVAIDEGTDIAPLRALRRGEGAVFGAGGG